MSFSYARLWRLLRKKNMTRTTLSQIADFSSPTLARMGKDEAVSMETLGKICQALSCDVGDIVEWLYEEGEEKSKG